MQKTWMDRIQRAKKAREKWETEFRVQMGWDYFEGRQNPGYPAEEWISIPKIYAHLMAQLPLLYSMDPYFYVKPKKSYSPDPQKIAEFEQKGRVRQAMLNYLKIELHLKDSARLGIQDAHFQFGVLKVRRASDAKKHPEAGKPIKGEDGKVLKDPDSGQPLMHPETVPVNERYELCRVNPDEMLLDEDAGPLQDSWSWIAQHRTMSKADARKDPSFDKKAVKSAKGRGRDKAQEKKTGIVERILKRGDTNEDEIFLDIWEVYDLKNKTWLTLAEDADDLLIEAKGCPKGVEKHPFSFLRFTLRKNSPYPIPPVAPAIDVNKEISLSRSRVMTHRKRFNRKYEVVTNKLIDPDTALSQLESGEDGTIIQVQTNGAVTPIQDAALDQQTYTELALLNNDLVETFGTPSQARGVADADSATEASILDKRLEVREGDRLSMVVDWITDIARKLDMLVQANIDREEAVKVTGPQGEIWETIRQEDYSAIEGEYEYSVNLGASQPRLPDIERAQWTAFMNQVVIPMPHILTLPAFMKRIAAMFHIEDEAALKELQQLGQKMLAGLVPMPGQTGGGPSSNPVAALMGAAGGPTGGNANGGGSEMVAN